MSVTPTSIHRGRAPHRSQVALFGLLAVSLAAIVAVVLAGAGVFGSGGTNVQGSGVPARQARLLAPFHSVVMAGTNAVMIRVGGPQSVVVHADANLLRSVKTRVRGSRLVISDRTGVSFTAHSPMYVEITVPRLSALTLSGDGVVIASSVDAESLNVSLSGNGVVVAKGRAVRLSVALSGSGDARLGNLAARSVHAVVSGSGRIVVTATNALDASVPGSGAIFYGGDPPVVKTSVTGSGAVVRS